MRFICRGPTATREFADQTAHEMIGYLGLGNVAGSARCPTCPSARRCASNSRVRSLTNPKLLLLDEPACGLNHEEVEDLGNIASSAQSGMNGKSRSCSSNIT